VGDGADGDEEVDDGAAGKRVAGKAAMDAAAPRNAASRVAPAEASEAAPARPHDGSLAGAPAPDPPMEQAARPPTGIRLTPEKNLRHRIRTNCKGRFLTVFTY